MANLYLNLQQIYKRSKFIAYIDYACPKGTKLRTCTYHFHYANIIFICPNISFNPNSSKLRKNRQSRVQIRRSRVEIRRSRVEIRRSRVEIRRSRVEIRRSGS